MSNLLDIGPLELEVLGLLNSFGEQSVSDIQAQLKNLGHDLAYTTVMTVLVRLNKKEMVKRRKEGRQFIYVANSKKSTSVDKIFDKVKKSLFRTEKLKPILSMLANDENDSFTTEELEILKKTVEEKIKKAKR